MRLVHHIAYFLYFDADKDKYHPLIPPEVLLSTGLVVLKFLPRNLYQIREPLKYFNLVTSSECYSNAQVFLSSGTPSDFEKQLPYEIGVVLWDKEELPPLNYQNNFSMPVILKDIHSSRNETIEFDSFIGSIIKAIETKVLDFSKDRPIRKLFLKKVNPSKAKQDIPDFSILETNYSIISQISGLFGHKLRRKLVKDVTDRPKLALRSVQNVDQHHYYLREKHFISKKEQKQIYTPYYPLPTLIVLSPWINPVVLDFSNVKKVQERMRSSYDEAYVFSKSMESEQDENYRVPVEERVRKRITGPKIMDAMGYGQVIAKRRLFALDSLASLHSTFQFSPVLRLPLLGKSINKELEKFSPKNMARRKDDREYYTHLMELGKVLTTKIPIETKEYIFNRPGPICLISDLPLEIAQFEDIPLFYLKDVCRLPESNSHSSLAEYVKHTLSDYKISENLLQRTLVVCTNPSDENIKRNFEEIKKSTQSWEGCESVRFEYSHSIKELAALVNDFKPELLILDTHGNAREDHLDSYLIVEGERLTGEEIVKHKISAPLVIMSSCYTAPTYGYVGPLAHAFFETGSFAVLSSILPLSMTGANILYARILGNLRMALKENIHDSWAGFISHNLRTSLFNDYLTHISLKMNSNFSDWVNGDKFHEVRLAWQIQACYHESIPQSYYELKDRIIEISKPEYKTRVEAILSDLNDFCPDAFAYTLMGRADLLKMPQRQILFEKHAIELLDGKSPFVTPPKSSGNK